MASTVPPPTAETARLLEHGFVRACSLEELQQLGTVSMGDTKHNVALFWHEGRVYAVDNRCPHMGFPLSRGSCKDGILTCYWHYARFDLLSGGSFDPGLADDVMAYPVVVSEGDVWVDTSVAGDTPEHRESQRQRAFKLLDDGLDQNLPLFQAKAVLRLLDLQVHPRDIVARGTRYSLRFGSRRNGGGWGDGTTILTAMATIMDDAAPEDRALALYHGLRRAAEDVTGQAERTELDPLPRQDVPLDRLRAWFRQFVEARQPDGAERVLRTAIAAGASPVQLIDMLAVAATDHYFRDSSHVMDTIAKQCELLDVVGWDQAAFVLPAIVDQLAASTREEERNSWHHPIDLMAIVELAITQLPAAIHVHAEPRGAWTTGLVDTLLDGDPQASIDSLMASFCGGMAVADAAQALAYAAALRLAHFSTSNEFGDWDTVLHDFTYCASLAQVARRAPSAELARGVLHGAMVVYLSRFLNIPAARLPDGRTLAPEPEHPDALTAQLLALFDQQGRVDEAASVVYRYLALGHDPARLLATLARAVLREDAGFHDYQTLEEGLRLAHDLEAANHIEEARLVLAGAGRWIAAHSPTRRAVTQTYAIARRLHRGDAVYENSA